MQSYYSAPKTSKPKEAVVVELPKLAVGASIEFKTNDKFRNSEVVTVEKPSVLREQPTCVVKLGTAPDGLPLLLKISRSKSIKDAVLRLLSANCSSEIDPQINSHIQGIEDILQRQSLKAGLEEEPMPSPLKDKLSGKVSNKIMYYKTSKDAALFFGNTLYANLVGDNSTSNLNERGEFYEEAQFKKKLQMQLGICLDYSLYSQLGPLSVKTTPEGKLFSLEVLFLENVFTLLPETKFEVATSEGHNPRNSYSYSSSSSPQSVYSGLLTNRTALYHAIYLSGSKTYDLLINRQDFAKNVLLALAKKIQREFHDVGRVHSDLKPSNILLLGNNGVKPIDARGCSQGSIATTYTPNWSAPEQVLGKPVSFASDVFALGNLALQLVDAQPFGEIRSFRMPGSTTPIEVLDTEGVWIEADVFKDEESRKAWRNSLYNFIAFSPEKRIKNAAGFIKELETLLRYHPIDKLKPWRLPAQISSNASLCFVSTTGGLGASLKESQVRCNVDVVPAWILRD